MALGALLGRYRFTRYRSGDGSAANGTGGPDLIVLSSVGAAAGRAPVLAEAMTLVRDLVNTSPADLYPETFAAEAQRVAVAAGLEIEVLDHVALAGGGYGGLTGVGQGSDHLLLWSGWPTATRRRPRPSSSPARASRSTPVGSRSSRRSRWRR